MKVNIKININFSQNAPRKYVSLVTQNPKPYFIFCTFRVTILHMERVSSLKTKRTKEKMNVRFQRTFKTEKIKSVLRQNIAPKNFILSNERHLPSFNPTTLGVGGGKSSFVILLSRQGTVGAMNNQVWI